MWLLLPVRARRDQGGRPQERQEQRPECRPGDVVARVQAVREGEGQLVPAGVPLAVADVLQHPEPVRGNIISRNK